MNSLTVCCGYCFILFNLLPVDRVLSLKYGEYRFKPFIKQLLSTTNWCLTFCMLNYLALLAVQDIFWVWFWFVLWCESKNISCQPLRLQKQNRLRISGTGIMSLQLSCRHKNSNGEIMVCCLFLLMVHLFMWDEHWFSSFQPLWVYGPLSQRCTCGTLRVNHYTWKL